MLQRFLRNYFCKRLYPTNRTDWYKKKGYVGENDQVIFADFLKRQRQKDSVFYKSFAGLNLKRFKVQSGKNFLDCVEITPEITPNNNKTLKQTISELFSASDNSINDNRVFILFQGRCEYYESRYRDMAMLSKATGAKVIGFNPKGFHSSTGNTRILMDIVDDGVAVVKHIIKQGYRPEDIIMLGNSLGGAVQEIVCQRLIKEQGLSGFRQINSNSFSSLGAVVAYRKGVPFLEKQISRLLSYAGWEIDVPDSFYEVGTHRIHLRRYQDRTILPGAEYHDKVDIEACLSKIPAQYKEQLSWIISHNQIKVKNQSDKDPHNLSLHHFILKEQGNDALEGNKTDIHVFDLIDVYSKITHLAH